MKIKKWNWILLLVLGLFMVVIGIQQMIGLSGSGNNNNNEIKPATGQNEDTNRSGPIIGAQAPDFTLNGLDGEPTYKLSDLKGDKPVLINLWASWCPPCKAEAPDLVRLYEKYRDEMEIYAVNLTTADSVEGAQQFVNEYGIEFPVLLDEEGEVGKMYQAISIPTSYFIDRSGRVKNKMIGITSPDNLEKMFQELIDVK
ncbi:TlpA family protein disulfide reductase [Aquibacillus sp. 3ASR75-11]|uniref:TlpA family protein disulfide reductase n=1 Tax=Terrihalobacillus insolitus TaxID=2950438 RepID=A0A9X3WRG4_9BACI|nr:TlpA disulfide reductase family protein [Terrihalobacillus insolitus]MDC3413836.1 TlpA family protein disulfide reductase [Terrihalobacillus insolitus]MDC3424517.1 TlpA family protein disulfide reductase [Terrihalobacillus insolitus]